MSDFKHPNLKSLLLAATIVASPLAAMPVPASAQVSVDISVQIAPPALPDYDQPPIPEVGYIWIPGYWYWSQDAGYYWVPGTWLLPPAVDLLWTPPYWDWADGAYVFHAGYWGPHVGYYGGVDYGYGYGGEGFQGGRWSSGHFVYNRAANNFGSVHVTNVYNQRVTVVNRTRVSYAGGAGGLKTKPSTADRQAERDRHVAATAEQTRHVTAAGGNPALSAKRNNGHPPIAATARPATFEGKGVVAAHGASRPGAAAPHAAGAAPGHPAGENPTATREEPSRPAAIPDREPPTQQHAAPRPGEEHPTATRDEPRHPTAAPGHEPPAEQHAAPRRGEERPTATREEPAHPAAAPAHEPPAEHAAPQRPAQAEPARPEGRPVVNREEPHAAPARQPPTEQHAPQRPEEHAAARPPQAAPAHPPEQHPAAAAPHPAPAHEAPAEQGHEKKPE